MVYVQDINGKPMMPTPRRSRNGDYEMEVV